MATQSHQQFGGSKLATQRVGLPYFVLDNRIRHYRAGAAPNNWHRNGELLHPGNPDKGLEDGQRRRRQPAAKLCKCRVIMITGSCICDSID